MNITWPRRRVFLLSLLVAFAAGVLTTLCTYCTPEGHAVHEWKCGCVPFNAVAPWWVSWPVVIALAWAVALALTWGRRAQRGGAA